MEVGGRLHVMAALPPGEERIEQETWWAPEPVWSLSDQQPTQ
jgi:hypothetical protein